MARYLVLKLQFLNEDPVRQALFLKKLKETGQMESWAFRFCDLDNATIVTEDDLPEDIVDKADGWTID